MGSLMLLLTLWSNGKLVIWVIIVFHNDEVFRFDVREGVKNDPEGIRRRNGKVS